jgi:uncharacterized membrane protein
LKTLVLLPIAESLSSLLTPQWDLLIKEKQPMVAAIIVGAGLGALLGLRFGVFVLIPASLFAVIAVLIAGMIQGHGFWKTSVTAVVVVATVQLGYLSGAVIQHATLFLRAARIRGPSFQSGALPSPSRASDAASLR